ncbi:MAG: hypothetical protein U1E27_13765, partial [Kiritimatiellia bacterium]|nr:hypothetical protein [Kiritimatiellia bacterium]
MMHLSVSSFETERALLGLTLHGLTLNLNHHGIAGFIGLNGERAGDSRLPVLSHHFGDGALAGHYLHHFLLGLSLGLGCHSR